MDFTISLAHFCELHGPTSIICTQAATSPCGTCNPCVTPPSEEASQPAISYPGLYEQPNLRLNSRVSQQLSSPFETPPTSPRSPTYNPYFPSYPGSDSALTSRRPSSVVDPVAETCENCQFTVSKTHSEKLPAGVPGSPSKDGRGRNGSPVLRTSKNFPVRMSTTVDEYSSSPESSDVSDTEQSGSYGSSASYPSSSPASPTFTSRSMHTHTLNYTSTGQPQSPTSYSLLRRTITRTLATETLPAGKSSGPLFFGDDVAGYTIAYVFRLQDPKARGHTRHYALIAMTGRDSRRASRAMVKVLAVFESIANNMVALAQKMVDREKSASNLSLTQQQYRSPSIMPTTPTLGSSAQSMPTFTSPQKERVVSSAASSPTARTITPVSSFLSAKRLDSEGYGRQSSDLIKPKNLTEIVGQENFFVQLHAQFVGLLHSLIAEFGV